MPIFKKRIKIGYKGYFLLDKEPFIYVRTRLRVWHNAYRPTVAGFACKVNKL